MAMEHRERENLVSAGWRVGDAADFLGLSAAESQLIDLRLAVGRAVRRGREARGMTQKQFAGLAGTTQPRIAKIESAAAEVSLDLMLHAFFAVGGRLSPVLEEPANNPGSVDPTKVIATPGKRSRKLIGESS